MQHLPKLFISFSSKDITSIREFMTFLKTQRVDFWDYSNELEAIDAASDIFSRLVHEIETCDYFIPVISTYSVDPRVGKFTCYEVEHALKIGLLKKQKIIPIVINGEEPRNWTGIYAALENVCHIKLDIRDDRTFVNAMIKLCKAIDIEFVPFVEAHPRLPFLKFFQQEIRDLSHRISDHLLLSEITGVFSRHFKQEHWQYCLFLINYFLDTCRYHLPDYQCFYPHVVKAVCERQLGLFASAEKSYKQAMQVRESDENVYGGLAGVYQETGKLSLAKRYAEKALQVCPPNENTDEIFNYVSILLQLQENIPERYFNAVISLQPEKFKGDTFRLLNLKGALYCISKQYDKAIDVFTMMEKQKICDTTTIGYHVNALLALRKKKKALDLLSRALHWSQENTRIDEAKIMEYILNISTT